MADCGIESFSIAPVVIEAANETGQAEYEGAIPFTRSIRLRPSASILLRLRQGSA